MPSEREDIQRRRSQLRGKLMALVDQPLMRGSIVERLRRCGRPNCACARDAKARHGGKVLAVHLEGRVRVVPLRAEDEPGVRQAVEAYGRLWDVINGLTACELSDLRRQVRERRRSRRKRS
jgi:hypothetical protein